MLRSLLIPLLPLVVTVVFLVGCGTIPPPTQGWIDSVADMTTVQLGEPPSPTQARIVLTRPEKSVGFRGRVCVWDTGTNIEKPVSVVQKVGPGGNAKDYQLAQNILCVTRDFTYWFVNDLVTLMGKVVCAAMEECELHINEGERMAERLEELFDVQVDSLQEPSLYHKENHSEITTGKLLDTLFEVEVLEYSPQVRLRIQCLATGYQIDMSEDEDEVFFYYWGENVVYTGRPGYRPVYIVTLTTSFESLMRALKTGLNATVGTACFINDLDVNETISWNRPPGTMRLEALAGFSDHALMRPLEVEAGKTYRIVFEYGLSGPSFEVQVEPQAGI